LGFGERTPENNRRSGDVIERRCAPAPGMQQTRAADAIVVLVIIAIFVAIMVLVAG
jgi:hypothetical protein